MSVKEQKKIVYYIGFYDGDSCSKRRRNKQNMAGTVYMKGLIHLLREMDYHVILVSYNMHRNQEYIVENI